MIMTTVGILMLVAAIVALYWFMVQQAAAKITAQYHKLAERFTLEMTEAQAQLAGFIRPEPFVHGDYRGRELSISVPGKGLQNTRQTETVLKVAVRTRGDFSLQMTASGMLGRLRQRDSGQKKRWLSGDPEFDRAIDVRTSDGVRLAMHLDRSSQQALAALLQGSRATIYLGQGTLAYAELGLIAGEAQRARFEQAVEVLCDCAETFEA